ncbi:MAG: hypothetical protein R3C26_01565 [Calditrichia bacterium]
MNCFLQPGEFHIYTDVRLDPPDSDLLLGIDDELPGTAPLQFALAATPESIQSDDGYQLSIAIDQRC